jgi:hypothetical protein
LLAYLNDTSGHTHGRNPTTLQLIGNQQHFDRENEKLGAVLQDSKKLIDSTVASLKAAKGKRHRS